MKMKNLFLIVGLCCCIPIMAQEASNLSFMHNMAIEPKLRPVETSTSSMAAPLSLMPARTLKTEAEVQENIGAVNTNAVENTNMAENTGLWAIAGKTEAKVTSDGICMQLDSVIGTNSDGSYSTRQYFMYNEKGKEIKRLNSYWNTTLNAWDEPVEEYNYEWDENGNILNESVVGYGAGKRIEYVYNDKGWGIQQIIYGLDADGEWLESSKGVYTYDDEANIIEEYIYVWDGTEWVNSVHNTATWDSKKRQTNYTGYVWDGREWTGNTNIDYIWFDGPQNPDYVEGTEKERMTYRGMYLWRNKEWVRSEYDYNEFNEDGRLSAQGKKCYNPESKHWGGGYDWGNGVVGRTYDLRIHFDEHGFRDYGIQKECLADSTLWLTTSEEIYDWTYAENGDREGIYKLYIYRYDDKFNPTDTIFNQQLYYGYNARNKKTWARQFLPNEQGVMEEVFEDKYGYDENGNLIYSASWDWKDGKRKPTLKSNYTYDKDGNRIELMSYTGGGGLVPMGAPIQKGAAIEPEDEEGWVNNTHWTYQYQNNICYEKMGYRWQNSEWATNNGQTVEYDWGYPASELMVPNGWKEPYKVNFIYDYTGDGKGGWLISTRSYYYSEHVSGIQKAGSANIAFFNNLLTITEGNDIENRVYDITGKQVYQGNSSEENLNLLSPGIYVARSTVDSKVSTLKIIIK